MFHVRGTTCAEKGPGMETQGTEEEGPCPLEHRGSQYKHHAEQSQTRQGSAGLFMDFHFYPRRNGEDISIFIAKGGVLELSNNFAGHAPQNPR